MKTRTEISIRNNIVANLFSHKFFKAVGTTVTKVDFINIKKTIG
jgi:hypothetical protein